MKKRVLVVDDEPNIRKTMRIALEAAGYVVGEAEHGGAALDRFGDGSGWDLVLLDQRMPGMEGLETLRRLRERAPTTRVVMVSAFASIELAVDAMKLGARDFLRKPMTPAMLRDATEAALAGDGMAYPDARPPGPPRPVFGFVTLNGFRLDEAPAPDLLPTERRFRVTHPRGFERMVIVELSEEALGRVRRLVRRDLADRSDYWTSIARRVVAERVWADGRLPAERIRVTEIGPEDLAAANRWEEC